MVSFRLLLTDHGLKETTQPTTANGVFALGAKNSEPRAAATGSTNQLLFNNGLGEAMIYRWLFDPVD